MSALASISSAYSSDSSEGEEPGIIVAKKPKLAKLPLPSAIQNLDEGEEGPADDPSLHDFRIRSFPHVRGNWASYVYIGLDLALDGLQTSILAELTDAKKVDRPHVSVSKVFALQHHWIDGFVAALKDGIKDFRPFRARFGDEVEVFVNDDKTRTFVALGCCGNPVRIAKLSAVVDSVLAGYGLEPFYRPARFHASLAWCLGDRRSEIVERSRDINDSLAKVARLEGVDFAFNVDNIRCKIGNREYTLALNK